MLKNSFALMLFPLLLIPLCLAASQPLSQRLVYYQISVRLDTDKKMLYGDEVVSFLNNSEDPLPELYLHLYWNAFRNEESYFIQQSPGLGRRLKELNGWGWVDIKSFRILDGPDLMEDLQIEDTVLKVILPEPLLPQQTIKLSIKFESKIPKGAVRAGYIRNNYFISQWFPKMAVYFDGEWKAFQYHPNSEFFADFGVYEVEITLPSNYVMGASGILVEERDSSDGTKTLHFHGEDIHDFAWTADPDYRIARDQYGDTEIIFLYQPYHEDQVDRHLYAVKSAMDYFHYWLASYPYPRITVVDPSYGSVCGGMEYPTLITAGTFWALNKLLPGLLMAELVTIHEFGHQYWYGMVANNEFEEAWLDEGINSYAEVKIMDATYGQETSALQWDGVKMGDRLFQRLSYLLTSQRDPIYTRSWEFYDRASYGGNVYNKAALMLLTLENLLGEETMNRIMSTYFERYQFKHPKTEDFIAVVNEVADRDMSWYFDQLLYGTGVVDYATASLSSEEDEEKELYLSKVRVERLGEVVLPVEILVSFENGEEVRELWDGRKRWKEFTYRKKEKLLSAQVDPEQKILLDINFLNNSQTMEYQARGVNRLAAKLLFWWQSILHLLASFS